MVNYSENFVTSNVYEYFRNTQNAEKFLLALTECYKNPSDIFQRVIAINDTVFVLTDLEKNNQVIGYLFYSDRSNISVLINDTLTKCIYNGYALINENYRKTGALKNLLLFATDYYCNKYFTEYQQLLFYAVTSNPFALRGYYNVFETARPSRDGLISQNDLLIANMLKTQLFIATDQSDHPFTFKTTLPQRYNEDVREIFIRSGLDEVKFLKQINVNEGDGDRFLFYWTILT